MTRTSRPSLRHTLERRDLESLLAKCHASVVRIAHGLTGRRDIAKGVIRLVMNRAMAQLDTWTDEAEAAAWFYHHTVLTTRQAHRKPDLQKDLLLVQAHSSDPSYTAFVHAVRSLGRQQMESFVLSRCESLNPRWLGVAMDCSMVAATQHLEAARSALIAIAGEAYETHLQTMESAYRSLGPQPGEELIFSRGAIAKDRRSRRLLEIFRAIVFVACLVALVAAGWWIWRSVELR